VYRVSPMLSGACKQLGIVCLLGDAAILLLSRGKRWCSRRNLVA